MKKKHYWESHYWESCLIRQFSVVVLQQNLLILNHFFTWRFGKRIIKTRIVDQHVRHQEEIGDYRSYGVQVTCKKREQTLIINKKIVLVTEKLT